MRLLPGLPLFERKDGAMQLGCSATARKILPNLTRAEKRLLYFLAEGGYRNLGQLVTEFGVPRARIKQLLAELDQAGFLWDPKAPDLEASWAKRSYGTINAYTARQQLNVRICGLNRLGFYLSRSLQQAGVGQLQLVDPHPPSFSEGDLYPLEQCAKSRAQLAAAQLGITGMENNAAFADLNIVISSRMMDVTQLGYLLSEQQTYLPVVIKETEVEVGPLFSPQGSPCPVCIAKWSASLDPEWAEYALAALSFPDLEVAEVLALEVSAFILRQVCQLAAGYGSELQLASWIFSARSLSPAITRWQPHPACSCGAVGIT